MELRPLDHPFWSQDCRGPALSHKHGEHIGDGPDHDDCPCRDCGLTQARWADAVGLNADDAPLQLPQGDAPKEPRLTWEMRPNKHKRWSGALRDYVDGDPKGPGRGELSPAWVEWALVHPWPLGGI